MELELRLIVRFLRERGTYGVYVVCKPAVGCRGGGRIGPARETVLEFPVAFAGVGMSEPVGLASGGLIGCAGAVGRLMNEEVGEEEVEEEAVDGVGETRPAGTTSG